MRSSLATAAILLFLVFLAWTATVVLPVLRVELVYQYKRVLMAAFHTTDIRTILFPQFSISVKSNNARAGIEIPSLFIDEPVIYNVDPNDERAYTAALKNGIAHASGTGLPGSGRLGYYFAHSSTPALVSRYNAVFYLLNRLAPGDSIIFWHQNTQYRYRVIQSRITEASDTAFLSAEYPKDTIVLQTCWPAGTTLKRLLVFAQAE